MGFRPRDGSKASDYPILDTTIVTSHLNMETTRLSSHTLCPKDGYTAASIGTSGSTNPSWHVQEGRKA